MNTDESQVIFATDGSPMNTDEENYEFGFHASL